MAQLYLIRGVPGSGKTTLARKFIGANLVDYHFEADFYMLGPSGGYAFNPKKLKDCHAICLENTKQALRIGRSVVVSNTFTRLWEMQPYLNIGCHTTVILCEGNFENVHNVPREKIAEMRDRFEEYTG